MNQRQIRVVLADDHALVRAGLRKLLESLPNVLVVGEVGDGLALIELAAQLHPDLILMDVSMPGVNGLEATVKVLTDWPATRVLILSSYQNEEYVRQALRHGAAGYLLKDAAPKELDQALECVMDGGTYLGSALSKGVLNDYVLRLRSDEQPGDQLTARQREVLKLIAEGSSTKDIARALDLSVKTVDTHRSQLMRQLDIHEVTGLVRFALRIGLISLDR